MNTALAQNILDDLQNVFQRSPLINSNSMLHGLLCALLSHPSEVENAHWYTHLEVLIERHSQKEKKALHQYAKHIDTYLQNDDYNLYLPEEFDDAQNFDNHSIEYRQKATHIANWIDGYIYGYAASAFIQTAKEHEHIQEWISVLQESQRLLHLYIGAPSGSSQKKESNKQNKDTQQEKEQAECDLIEITEFIRISIYLTREIWHQLYHEEKKQVVN